jgi:hypothetical protein
MRSRLTTSALSVALQIYEVGTASVGLLSGVYTPRGLIRPARMVAGASFGSAELPAISESECRHANKLAASRRFMSGPTRSSTAPRREDLALAGAPSARLQHLESHEALRFFAGKRRASACRLAVLWLVRGQPTEASATVDRREPAGRPSRGSGANPAQEAISLQAGDVRGLLPPAAIEVVVGRHFALLSVWGLGSPNRTLCPRPYCRQWMKAMTQSRSRDFSGQVPAVPVSVLQIPRVSVDDYDHPRSAPVQTGAQQCKAARPPIVYLCRLRRPPTPAARRRAWRPDCRRGSERQRVVATEQPLSDPFEKRGACRHQPAPAPGRDSAGRRRLMGLASQIRSSSVLFRES